MYVDQLGMGEVRGAQQHVSAGVRLGTINRKNPKHSTRSQKVTQCWHKTPFWVPC